MEENLSSEKTNPLKSGKKVEKPAKPKEKVRYTKKELEAMSFNEVKEIGKSFGTTDRSKDNLIKEILQLQ